MFDISNKLPEVENKNDRNPDIDDILSSFEFDKFKEKEAYNKDEFYITLCTVAKRAKAFRELFLDR
jgi:hypothetical protein